MSLLLLLKTPEFPGWGDAWDEIDLQIDWTNSMSVPAESLATATFTISASSSAGSVLQMQFSENDSDWDALEDYATSKEWAFSDGLLGAHTLYARFKDDDDNVSPSVNASTDITGVVYGTLFAVDKAESVTDYGDGDTTSWVWRPGENTAHASESRLYELEESVSYKTILHRINLNVERSDV